MADKAEVVGETILGEGEFLSFKRLDWRDASGGNHQWEAADRVGLPGAVLICARLMPSDRFILIRQFRPPARRMVVEFPAGLIDPGETAGEAAERELREETGYAAARLRLFESAYTTPGLSSESVYMVLADIDEQAPENLSPKTEFDGSEDIETILVPRDELFSFYTGQCAGGAAFDAKLAAFILAVSGPLGMAERGCGAPE
jgi:8-oxo-dGTP pyrophosphatase MutT (NUDIX family)